MGSAQVSIATKWEVGDDDPTLAEKHLVWHWGKMTHNPSKTIVILLQKKNFGKLISIPTHSHMKFEFSLNSVRLFFFFFFFLPATCGGGTTVDEQWRRERERERERERDAGLECRERLTERQTALHQTLRERERDSQMCIFVGFRDRNGINDSN